MSKWKRLQKFTSLKGLVSESHQCIDCGFDTHDGQLNRAESEQYAAAQVRAGKPWSYPVHYSNRCEVYIVHQHVWAAAGLSSDRKNSYDGCLCIECLERRIDRPLTPDDFDHDHPFFQLPGTERMLRRQGRYQHYDFEFDNPPPTELERALSLIGAP